MTTTPTDWRALCAEQLPELRGMFERILCVARSSGGPTVGNIQLADQLLDAVVSWSATTLAQSEPQGPTKGDISELYRKHGGFNYDGMDEIEFENAVNEALTLSGRPAVKPEPQGASVEAMAQIVYEHAMLATAPKHAKPHWPSWVDLPNSDARIHSLNTAEIILTRWGRPAIKPVPVAERLPRAKDCDANGIFWAWDKGCLRWDAAFLDAAFPSDTDISHWLPHWALPVPQQKPGQ